MNTVPVAAPDRSGVPANACGLARLDQLEPTQLEPKRHPAPTPRRPVADAAEPRQIANAVASRPVANAADPTDGPRRRGPSVIA